MTIASGYVDIAPESPTAYFSCVLDDQPSWLVPRRLLASRRRDDVPTDLIVNPCSWFSFMSAPPIEVLECLALLDKFAVGTDMVWVGDPATRVVMPFWIGSHVKSVLSELRPGDPVPSTLSRALLATMTSSAVFVNRSHYRDRMVEWNLLLNSYSAQFIASGYLQFDTQVHPYYIGSLRQYYRRLLRGGIVPIGDGQCPRRYGIHNESAARFFHYQLTRLVAAIVGRPLKPSYVYLVSYQSGAELKRHTDRAQCEYTVSLCIDCSPEPEDLSPWPIHLDTPNGTVTVFQGIGDALLFCGRSIPHYRTTIPEGVTSTSLLFHYVDEAFDQSLL